MRPLMRAVIAVTAMNVAGCGTPSYVQSDEPGKSQGSEEATITQASIVASDWSEPVNGLEARWLLNWQPVESDKHPTYAHYREITLEVKNVGSAYLSFDCQPTFESLMIRDANGKLLEPPGHIEGNHPSAVEPQWATVPHSAYLGLRIDTTIPVRQGVHFESFATADHSLHATLVAQEQDGPKNQWTGEIKLPPLAVNLSRETP